MAAFWATGLWVFVLAAAPFPGAAVRAFQGEPGGLRVPAAQDIIHRVLTVNARTPDVASAHVVLKFRVHRTRTDPPNCIFDGTLRLDRQHQVLSVDQLTAGLTCWLINRLAIGRLFEGREPVQSFLARFEFTVLGQKLVDGQPFYLVQGKARDPKTRPRGLIGWVDYERGLVTEGTLDYDWGSIDTEQRYTQTEGAWVLTYQYLTTQFLEASMELFYSDVRFAAP